jgi:N-acetylneuraminic acid mutarotase
MTGILALAAMLGGPWQPAPALPEGIAGFGHGVVDDKLVVFGGSAWRGDTKVILDTAWRLDREWHALPSLPRRFAYGVYWNTDGTLVANAGDDGITTHRDGFSISGRVQPPELLQPVAYAGCTSDGDRVYVLGGTTDIRDVKQARAEFLVLRGRKWTGLPDYPGGPVIHAALVTIGGNVLVFPGGIVGTTIRNTAQAWRFVTQSGRWERITDYPMEVRGLGVCALNDRYVLLAGGDTGNGNTARCYIYDVTANCYLEAPALPVSVMMVGLERVGTSVYAFGGEDRARHRSTAVYHARVEDLLPPP